MNKLNFTELIKTAAWIVVAIYAIGEFSRPIEKPEQVTIDFHVSDSTNRVIRKQDSLLAVSKKIIDSLKTKRNAIPKEVALYTDSDLIHFTDSFSAVYGVNGHITIQAVRR